MVHENFGIVEGLMTTVHARDIWISFGEEDNGKLGRNGEKILHSNIIGSENFSRFFFGTLYAQKLKGNDPL